MKNFIIMLILLTSTVVFADDRSCKDSQFKYRDVVKVIDKGSFFFECTGTVTSADGFEAALNDRKGCSYYVEDVCGDQNSTFIADQLQLVKKGSK